MMQTLKKRLALLFAAVMLLSLLPATALAAEGELPMSGACGENLTWVLSEDGVLTIYGTGDMEDYDYWEGSRAPWNDQSSAITNVVIGDGVTSIGDFAFAYCHNLTSATVPDSVKSIGEQAFIDCKSLTEVTIPTSVAYIGDGAFAYCASLPEVTIPDGVTSIGDGTFENCDNLTSVTIPDSVTSIGDWAFYGCDSLTDVYYGGSEKDWAAISIRSENKPLTNATIHYSGSDPVDDEEYVIVPEASSTIHVVKSGESVVIYCTGELNDFIQLLVDGEVVDPSYYELAEGSTIITIIDSYLDTLSVGTHSVELEFTNGTAETTITILERVAEPEPEPTPKPMPDDTPNTGSASNLTLWVAMMLLSAVGMFALGGVYLFDKPGKRVR